MANSTNKISTTPKDELHQLLRRDHDPGNDTINSDGFVYPPLLTSKTSIRLLELLRQPSRDRDIHCRLTSVDLYGSPTYRALSYTWDCPVPEDDDSSGIENWSSPTQDIICNDQPFPVRQNLYDALQQLMGKKMEGVYWIDSLCINQQDLMERGTQVAMMGDIFASADEVICWLGRADAHTKNVVELHRRLPPLIRDRGPEEVRRLKPTDIDTLVLSSKSSGSSNVLDAYISTERLFKSYIIFCRRRWFWRLWIAQEVGLAKQLSFLCGGETLAWEDLRAVARHAQHAIRTSTRLIPKQRRAELLARDVPGHTIRRLGNIRDDQYTSRPRTGFWANTRWTDVQQQNALLLETLIDTASFDASDSRDKIYGIAGLVSSRLPSINSGRIHVDYQMLASNLFTEVASALINGLPLLSVLGGVTPESSACKNVLPSWVPDFSSQKFGTHRIAKKSHCAGINPGEEVLRQRVGLRLMLSGHMLDVVSTPHKVTRTVREDILSLNNGYARSVMQPNILASYYRTATKSDKTGNIRSLSEYDKSIFRSYLLERLRRTVNKVPHDQLQEMISSLEKLRDAGYDLELPSRQDIVSWSTPDLFERLGRAYTMEIRRRADGFRRYISFLHFAASGLLVGTHVECQADDQVWIIRGAQAPIVLRPVPNSTDFTLVGEAYVDGVMFGEALKADDCPEPVKVTIV